MLGLYPVHIPHVFTAVIEWFMTLLVEPLANNDGQVVPETSTRGGTASLRPLLMCPYVVYALSRIIKKWRLTPEQVCSISNPRGGYEAHGPVDASVRCKALFPQSVPRLGRGPASSLIL